MALITKLNQIAQAIGRKTGEPASTYNIDNMASAIDNIQTDFPVVPPTPIEDETVDVIQFIDYDGTVVAQFNVEDASEITQLPEIPTHQGLTATGWTATLAQVQNATHAMIVGATYQSSADPTQTIFQILPYSGQVITLNLGQSTANAVTIDWGDGSATETSATAGDFTVTHTYSDVSNAPFEIALTPAEGETLSLGHGTSATKALGVLNRTPLVVVVGKTTIVKDYAFNSYYGLYALTLPNSGPMSSVPMGAFTSCTRLPVLILPTSVTTIPGGTRTSTSSDWSNGALAYVQNAVVIPNTVTTIGPKAFYAANIKTIILPDSITSIGDNAFESSYLETYRLPNNPSLVMGVKVFRACNYLKKAIISVISGTTIGGYLFSHCLSLDSVVLNRASTYMFAPSNSGPGGSSSDYMYNYSLSKVTLTDVTSIENYAFYNCYGLKSIEMPNTVTTIGTAAFQYCHSLENIVIPSSVTSIGNGSVFQDCYSLKSITFLGNSITSIPQNAFNGCSRLESIVIPDGVTSIGSSAFSGCSRMKSMTIPASMTTLNANMLKTSSGTNYSVYSLETIKFKDRTSIPSTFAANSIFNSTTNPGPVTTLDFTEQTTVPTFDGTFFTNMPSYVKIKVPAALEAEWKATSGWSTYANQIVGVSE